MKQSTRFPVLLAALGVLLFSLLDALMKAQALAMGTYSAMFWRMAFGVLFAVLLFSPSRVRPISGQDLKIHMLRATVTTLMTYLLFFSLTRIPLAQAIGLFFIAPIVALFLAAPLLGERVHSKAKIAAGLGFMGGGRCSGGWRVAEPRCRRRYPGLVSDYFICGAIQSLSRSTKKTCADGSAHGNHLLPKYYGVRDTTTRGAFLCLSTCQCHAMGQCSLGGGFFCGVPGIDDNGVPARRSTEADIH